MEQNELMVLDYLEDMDNKVVEILTPLIVGNSYEVTKEQPFPNELMRLTAQVVIDVAVVNETNIKAFHGVPMIEGHMYMLDMQDKNQQTVASVMMLTTRAKSRITVDEVYVAFKKGAIIGRMEEMEQQSVVFEAEAEEAQG